MPALARVIENTRHGDGTIESTVRVTASLEDRAKGQALRAALRHNGYSDVLINSEDSKLSVDSIEVESEGMISLRKTYVVKVTISGAGEFLQG